MIKRSIVDIDQLISDLEKDIHGSDDESCSSTLSSSEGKINEPGILVSLAEERIAPLPTSYLPALTCGRRDRIGTKESPPKKKKIKFEDETDKYRLEEAAKALAESYTPTSSERRPFWCRICKFQGSNLPEFENHRESSFHRSLAAKERELSYCSICRKRFTSPVQLTEHLKGKGHEDQLSRKGRRREGNFDHR